MNDLQRRIRSLKTVLGCVILCVGCVLLLALARVIMDLANISWLATVLWNELGAVLFGAGPLGVGLDAYVQRKNEAIAEAQLSRFLCDHASAIRDAVILGFASSRLIRGGWPRRRRWIRSSATSWRCALAMRGPLANSTTTSRTKRSGRLNAGTTGLRLDGALGVQRGARSPDPALRRGLRPRRVPRPRPGAAATSAWYLRQRQGLDPSNRAAFELVQFTVDGQDRPIRHQARKDGQTYTVNLGTEVLSAGQPVTISYTYRTLVSRDGHLLHVDVEQPTRGIRVELDYSDTDIDYVKLVDFIASTTRSRLTESPSGVPGRSIGVEFDGWLMPRSGVAFVWVHGTRKTLSFLRTDSGLV